MIIYQCQSIIIADIALAMGASFARYVTSTMQVTFQVWDDTVQSLNTTRLQLQALRDIRSGGTGSGDSKKDGGGGRRSSAVLVEEAKLNETAENVIEIREGILEAWTGAYHSHSICLHPLLYLCKE